MKAIAALLLPSSAFAFTSSEILRTSSSTSMPMADEVTSVPASKSSAVDDLKSLASDLNPVIGFWDPLSLTEGNFWEQGEEATVGFLRQAEIKHGRVAMAAFVGYCVQSNWVFPWAQTLAGATHPSPNLSPEQQWDAIPANAKWQIIAVIGFLELWDECGGGGEKKHYMRGGKPGDYPSFQSFRDDVHFVFDLYDPFGFHKKMSDERKERGRIVEINNGRLAMLGIFGFLSADKIEGSVPALNDIAIPYDGDIMAPFAADGTFFAKATDAVEAVAGAL